MTVDKIKQLTPKQKSILTSIHKYPYNLVYDIMDTVDSVQINPELAFKLNWILYDSLSVTAVNTIIECLSEKQRQFITNFYINDELHTKELIKNIPSNDAEREMRDSILKLLRQHNAIEYIKKGHKFQSPLFFDDESKIPEHAILYRPLVQDILFCYYESKIAPLDNIQDETLRILSDKNCLKGLEHILTQMPNELYSVLAMTWLYNIPDDEISRILGISQDDLRNTKTNAIQYVLEADHIIFITEGYNQGIAHLKKQKQLEQEQTEKEAQQKREAEIKSYMYVTDVPVEFLYTICNSSTVFRLKKFVETHPILNVEQIKRLSDDELRTALDIKTGTTVIKNIRNGIAQIEELCNTNRLNLTQTDSIVEE